MSVIEWLLDFKRLAEQEDYKRCEAEGRKVKRQITVLQGY